MITLWVFTVLSPLAAIISSFFLQNWNWDVIDDFVILDSGSGIISKFLSIQSVMKGFGEFEPVAVLYASFMYTILNNHPIWFYVFKAIGIIFTLFIWGFAAFRITKRKLSIVLVPAVTLSFQYFYDAFFRLWLHEIIGLFFIGIAMHFFLNNLENSLGSDFRGRCDKPRLFDKSLLLASFFLLCAFGSKEVFVSGGAAFGFSYIYLAAKYRRNNYYKFLQLLLSGLAVIFIAVICGVFLFVSIRSGYTSSYNFYIPKLISNLYKWFNKDFINHLPWIGAVIFIYYSYRKDTSVKELINRIPLKTKWGIGLAVLFYSAFFLMLLPWNTIGYYATPLGLFFAFAITLLVSDYLSGIKVRQQLFIVIGALIMNQFVCQYALIQAATYQYDTSNLGAWICANQVFRDKEHEYGIHCNSSLAADSIPVFIKRKYDLQINRLYKAAAPDQCIYNPERTFYFYSSRFNNIDLTQLSGWKIVFFSKNWIVYEKPGD